jgi:xanthine permease
MANAQVVDKTNEMMPVSKLFALGLQHVLTMYAGAVAVPLIVGGAIGLTPKQIAFLVAADLFACGIATLIQSFGIGNFAGIKLPAVLGCSFAAVGPLITIAKETNVATAYGSIIIAGLFVVLIAPLYGKLLRFFPPVVTGTILTVIGMSLVPVGINNIAGGIGNPNFGDPKYLLLAFFTMAIILIMNKFFKGFLQALSVLVGLVVGTVVASFFGMVNMTEVYEAQWVAVVHPFAFGIPEFHIGSVLMMCLVMLIIMIESTGSFIGIAKISGKQIGEKEIVKGMRAEGLATVVGGIFNSFPYTTFSQNIGLLALTKVTSRYVVIAAGFILMALGTLPKFAALATIIPAPVFGGATAIMFAMVAVAGIQTLVNVDFTKNSNMLVVATSLTLGLGVAVVPGLLAKTPEIIRAIFDSGIVTASVAAVVLNIFLNWGDKDSVGTVDTVTHEESGSGLI